MKQLFYLNKYFFKYRYRLMLGVVFVAASNIFGVLSPRVVRYAINLVTDNQRLYYTFEHLSAQQDMRTMFMKVLLIFGGVFLGLAVIKGIFMFFMRQTIIVMSRMIEYDLKNELYAHYQVLDLGFYKRHNTGDLMSRVAEDVSRVRMYLGPAIMYFINLTVLFTLVISSMIQVNPQLTIYVLLPLPILSISIYYVNNIINRRSEEIQRQLSRLTTIAQEVFSGIRVIKAYVQEKPIQNYFESECESYKDKSLGLARVEALFHPLMLLLIGMSTIITIFIGGIQVMHGATTAGNVAEFVIYVNMLTWPVASLGWVASIVQRAAASQKRINEFLNTAPAITVRTDSIPAHEGALEFDHVSFVYEDSGTEALKDISFILEPGQKVAIFGRTGSGKSTIAELIVRMYDPDSGTIRLNGTSLKDLDLISLRKKVAYVPQDVFLFSDTISYNILFGIRSSESESTLGETSLTEDGQLKDLRQSEVRKLAEYASIDEEIMRFPENYRTMVGERGVTLSGGQKQRISIARALATEAPVLVLDDCLSAVDAKTEQEILKNMQAFLKDKTALIITHRIFSLIDFDRILVLDEGRIVEHGTHSQLLKTGGLYAELYEKQKREEKYMN